MGTCEALAYAAVARSYWPKRQEMSPTRCQKILTGTGYRRQTLPGLGMVRVTIRSSAYIAADQPLVVSTTARGGKVKLRYAEFDWRLNLP